jgi:hypothetical protein
MALEDPTWRLTQPVQLFHWNHATELLQHKTDRAYITETTVQTAEQIGQSKKFGVNYY